jgi:hypothetical protein
MYGFYINVYIGIMLNPFGTAFYFNLIKVYVRLTLNFGDPFLVFYAII